MIGVIVEGIGEIPAIRLFLERIDQTKPVLGAPLRADLQPKANPNVIARSAKTAVNQLRSRGANTIVVLIDREDRDCHVQFSSELRATFATCYPGLHFEIVVKNCCFENWLLADPDAFRQMPARFSLRKVNLRTALRAGRADELTNPVRLLNTFAIKTEYHKGQDPARIVAHQKLEIVAANSRSFRKFLRAVGHRAYETQSKRA